jgi:hypothetical protein
MKVQICSSCGCITELSYPNDPREVVEGYIKSNKAHIEFHEQFKKLTERANWLTQEVEKLNGTAE